MDLGHEVVGADLQFPDPSAGPAIVSCSLDIRDRAAVHALMEAARPAAVVHMAGMLMYASQKNPDAAYEVNVAGTWNVARAAAGLGSRLLFASTVAAYGKHASRCGVASACHPNTAYGQSKLAAEAVCRLALGDRVRVLRIGVPYGGAGNTIGEGAAATILAAFHAAARGEHATLKGAGQVWPMIHYDDLVEVIVEAALDETVHTDPINAVTENRSTAQMSEDFRAATGGVLEFEEGDSGIYVLGGVEENLPRQWLGSGPRSFETWARALGKRQRSHTAE